MEQYPGRVMRKPFEGSDAYSILLASVLFIRKSKCLSYYADCGCITLRGLFLKKQPHRREKNDQKNDDVKSSLCFLHPGFYFITIDFIGNKCND